MTTGTKIVQSAMQKIGVHSPLQPATPEALATGLRVLNAFRSELQDRSIDVGAVPIEDLGDDFSEALGSRNAIEYNLALALAPDFPGAQVSQELSRQARLGMAYLKRKWQTLDIPKPQVRETLPKGQGNQSDRGLFHQTFFDEGEEVG